MTLIMPKPLLPEGFIYLPKVMSSDKSSGLYTHLAESLNWQQPSINMFGKSHPIPRLQCFIADPNANYTYSNSYLKKEAWPSILAALRTRLESHYGHTFNAVLVNWYRDGKDSMGWHSDDEAELGDSPFIVSLSLGSTRKFLIRDKQSQKQWPIMLEDGSCLIMQGLSQLKYQHSLPKQLKVNQGRINLTFRSIIE
jgi:alkylated DNA repair dioxygenase AlkB